MGNAVSKVGKIGLKAVCHATGGAFGLSNEGFHVGPLRLKKESIGVKFNYGICSGGVTVGKNEFGKMAFDVRATCGIPGVCSGTVRAGKDTGGFYGGVSSTLKVGKLQANVNLVADSDGIRTVYTEVGGPGMSNIKYCKLHGLSGGVLGVNVDENLKPEMDWQRIEDHMGEKVGEKAKKKYDAYSKELENKNNKQENTDKKKIKSGFKCKCPKSEKEKSNFGDQKQGAKVDPHVVLLKAKLNIATGSKGLRSLTNALDEPGMTSTDYARRNNLLGFSDDALGAIVNSPGMTNTHYSSIEGLYGSAGGAIAKTNLEPKLTNSETNLTTVKNDIAERTGEKENFQTRLDSFKPQKMVRKRNRITLRTDEKKINSEEETQIKNNIYVRDEGEQEYCSFCKGPCKLR